MRRLIAAAVLVPLLSANAAAQGYFGQNKVQYTPFEFSIIQTEHFDVHYYGNRQAALDAARMAERGYARLSRILQHEWRERKPLILYANATDFNQTNTYSGDLGEGTGGFTEFYKHRIVLPWTGSYADFEHVLTHELVHAFQYDIFARGRVGAGFQTLAAVAPPLWFAEGMAEYLSIGPVDPHTAMWMRDAALNGRIPTIEQLTYEPYRYFPYRFGHALWAYIGQKWGDETIGAILQGTLSGGIERAFQRVLGISLEDLGYEWREAVQSYYLPQIGEHETPRRFARPVLNRRNVNGAYRVSPQISPDGRLIAYMGERNFFFVDLHLADAERGRYLRRLVRSSFDPNFESLRFIYSAGSWSPDGSEFVFAAKAGASDVLNILTVASGRIRRVRPEVRAILNPAFSPDGQRIVFTGMDGGWSDLYVVDRDGENLRRLTNDRYADLHPQWSPDGATIAFVTDRGPGTDFSILRFGNLRIALFHLDGDSIRVLPRMDEGKNTNPVWAPDGRSLAFLSDRSGVDNVFLYDFEEREVYQLTSIFTGVSGITDLSPAISWARGADRLVFNYYENGDYNVYAIDNPRSLRREPYRTSVAGWLTLGNASSQPLRADFAAATARRGPEPAPALAAADSAQEAAAAPGTYSIYRGNQGGFRPSRVVQPTAADSAAPPPISVAALLDSAELALPDTTEFTTRRYRSRFSPDFVSRPTIGYARDNFGRGFFGGTAVQLSDILGDKVLTFAGQVNGRLSEAQIYGLYLNQERRLNWAVGVSQVPYYLAAPATVGTRNRGGETYDVIVQELRRYVFRSAFAQAFMPVNRFRRWEAGISATAISDASLAYTHYYSQLTGVYQGTTEEVLNGVTNSYFSPSVALVFDNSLFGYTSPFYGKRYRLEASQAIGDWNFTQLLADYRRYDGLGMPFVNFATRVLFLGRFGRSENDVIPVYLGSTELVRGYTYGSFRRHECQAATSLAACGDLEQLLGARAIVANAEFRFPLIRTLALGILPIGFPPIEGALFFDAGMAWNGGNDVGWSRVAGSSSQLRAPVTSYGFGLRANLFNFLILRLDYSVPRNRPGVGGYWTLSLGPPY
jgi:Tol biopolymer transport system component